MSLTRKQDPLEAVKIPEYRSLMAGRFIFIMGLRMMGTLVGWWIYNLTNDPLAIGLVGLSEVIPAVSLALYAGHVIDLSEKRKMILRGVLIYALCALILLMLSTKFTSAHLTNHWIAVCIYAVIFCTGITRAFTGPVFGVLVAYIVPKNILQNATTWNQGVWLTASVVGHAMGGLLISYAGITGTLIVICSLILAAFFVMLQLKPKPALNEPGEKKTWDSVKEGLRFVFKTKEVLGALSLDLFAVLFGGAVAMVPVYARDILKVGAIGFGWLNAAMDIGSICIVVMLTVFPLQRQQGRKLFFAVGGFGTCIIIFALSKFFWLSFFALMLSGMLDGISVVIRGTILQLKTPDNMRGRVMSVNSMFINSSNELGQFESGVAAKMLGVVPSVVFGGCMTLLVVITTWFKAPSLRKMEY
ncbi:MFS transporter [Panacibacter ginsenosidivorans]|uniref:MFS transporter n=1 Tax=Panacibacter ginsenosidivorans TaxID=1813871 RepID=A0A5B8V6N5_9BACT|nr:MFS transporter [Panacibacter ginsenosidivorans]QEC66411.1 MFS transporter [Panacibacter ginsenosidivorans]